MSSASRLALAAMAALAAGCHEDLSASPAAPTPLALADLAIEVPATASRAYYQTDKGDAYWYGEAAGPHQASWQGLNVRGFRFLDDWHWTVKSGAESLGLGWSHFAGASVRPDRAERRYDGGLTERITLVEGKRALLVEPTGAGPLSLRPLVSDSLQASYFQVLASGGALAFARTNHLTQSGPGDWPVWVVVKAKGATAAVDGQVVDGGGLKPKLFGPGTLTLPAATPVVIAVGETLDAATATADAVLADPGGAASARAARMEALLQASWVRTQGDARFDRALGWIRLSMDALVMDQQGKGIFAGLPWFNNYWGRDTFISLGGSHLATGAWEEAKEILTSFAAHQDVVDASPTFGRIPNTVSLGGTSYNTADGTPWFVIQASAYLERTGYADLAALWPVVKRATDGALRHVDASGFLLHGDQETWMDATGPDGPYTPRGTRAVEIQGLFHQQLAAAARLADRAADAASATAYRAADARLVAAFLPAYRDDVRGELFDKLDADGAVGTQVRPNQLIALRAMADVLPGDTVASMSRQAASRTAYPHGVASLYPFDPDFHPYHILAGYYPKDAAYHNGVVWGWLSGPLVSLMASQGGGEKAYEQLQALADLALDRATIGTLPELLDALPRLQPGANPPALGTAPPQTAGTPYQAWSHGEWIRNAWEDLVGVQYLAVDHVLLAPHLPKAWGETYARFRMGGGAVVARLTPSGTRLQVQLSGEGALPSGAKVTVRSPSGATSDLAVAAGQVVSVELDATPPASRWDGFAWLDVVLPDDLACLQFPGFVVLDRAAIKQAPSAGVKTRVAITDPTGDDTGPEGQHYTYPTDVHFQPGILDLTGFTLREDADAFYFQLDFAALVQPGWNPQDGFQLTYAAILFDTGAPGQATEVAHAAGYTMPAGTGFQYAVYVGAGFEVQDALGHVTASYVPQPEDVIDPLGSVDTKAITFRVPKGVIPALPSGTKVTVLAGSQDDYGNGSMGDFRKVLDVAGQWAGGGNAAGGPFVYDFASGTLSAP